MKNIVIVLALSAFLSAENYYAKVEPIERYTIKSNVSGKVIYANELLEGNVAHKNSLMIIDSENDKNEYSLTKEKLRFQKDLVALNQRMYEKKRDYFNAISMLGSKSEVEKDNAYYAQANAKIQFLNSQSQMNDLEQRLFTLEKSLEDKNVTLPSLYIKKLYVRKGDYVTMGTTLLDAEDLSQAKLTLYISKEDALHYKEMVIAIDGKTIEHNRVKVWSTSDSEHLSLYKAEIITVAPQLFSTLVQVTFSEASEK